jgi:hypothetical protein
MVGVGEITIAGATPKRKLLPEKTVTLVTSVKRGADWC